METEELDELQIQELPSWNASALAAIGEAILRAGYIEQGRAILDQVAAEKEEGDEWYGQWHLTNSFVLALTAMAQGGDIEGALARTMQLSEATQRAEGLILIGEVQAEAEDAIGAWQTLNEAVVVSGEPYEGATTSLEDIANGAIRSGKKAAAILIIKKLKEGWVKDYLEENFSKVFFIQKEKSDIPGYECFPGKLLIKLFRFASQAYTNMGNKERSSYYNYKTHVSKHTYMKEQANTITALARAGFITEAIQKYREAAAESRHL